MPVEDYFIDKGVGGGLVFPETMISFRSACTSAESALPVEASLLARVRDWSPEHLGRCSP